MLKKLDPRSRQIGCSTLPEVVAKVLNIKEGLNDTGDNNINNIQVSNKEDESV